jgi:hypothetical protein
VHNKIAKALMMRRHTLITVIFMSCYLAACEASDSSQPKAMLSENLQCPVGSVSEIERWGGVGENGWSHSCKMMHGKYHVWRGDVLAIEGLYDQGKKTGKWLYRNKNGELTKTITYVDGKMVSESTEKSNGPSSQ